MVVTKWKAIFSGHDACWRTEKTSTIEPRSGNRKVKTLAHGNRNGNGLGSYVRSNCL